MTTRQKKPLTGLLVVISGPSGVGKSTVVTRLLKEEPELRLSISATTRAARPGEKNGKHYFFLKDEEFKEKEKNSQFIEWAQVHGYHYGTPKDFVEKCLGDGETVILEVDVQGATQVKERVEKGKIKAATVFIFLIPPSVDILAFRLKKRRTENKEIINRRLQAALSELQVMEKYDYIVVNDQVENAASKIQAIINVEKERVMLN